MVIDRNTTRPKTMIYGDVSLENGKLVKSPKYFIGIESTQAEFHKTMVLSKKILQTESYASNTTK